MLASLTIAALGTTSPVTMREPSGEKAAGAMPARVARSDSVKSSRPPSPVTARTLAVTSSLAVTIRFPSGLQSTPLTRLP